MEFSEHILIEILSYLKLKDLLKMEQLSKSSKNIIRKNKWSNFTVKTNDYSIIEYTIKQYNFANYNFYHNNFCAIMTYRNCHKLTFSNYRQVTDESIKLLGKLCRTKEDNQSLDLFHCYLITYKDMRLLSNYRLRNFSYYNKIIIDTLNMLGNYNTFSILGCNQAIY
uniref:F-box domain-containing protein n=1 Tax=viral metagenome TaxID=1070528 RepID=A0A6C0LVU3_9ZZZZ